MATKRAALTVGGIGLAVVLGVGTGAAVAASTGSAPSDAASVEVPQTPPIQTNANGETYGSLAGLSDDEAPDLVAVEMEDGLVAYVRSVELFEAEGGNVSSPEEALAYERARASEGPVSVTAYESDGVTVVGEWFLGGVDYLPDGND